ncbi:hypothetical protein BGZ75_001146, partial [Mortierella antarctica]
DIFDSDLQETPETPSKRTKIDAFEISVVGRRTTSNVGLKTPVRERSVNNSLADQSVPSSPSSRVLDCKRTLAVRSPKLTLDDLRAPTPKPMKISNVDGGPAGLKMPIMFLHTPQQKKLYEMLEDTEIPKLSRPFSALTPSSKSDDKFGRKSLSLKTSLKSSPFASSIFTRFKTSSGLQMGEGRSSGSESLHSDAGHLSSQLETGRATGRGEFNSGNASEDDHDDDDEDDSRGFSPPAVSPLRMPRLNAHRSLTASMLSSSSRDMAGFVLPKRIGRKADIPFKPADRPVVGKSRERGNDPPNRAQLYDAEAKRFLDEPIQQNPFLAPDQAGEEDCTMLNSELQPIFNNNEATEGLLGEAMPESLDPEEILWETTEAFA